MSNSRQQFLHSTVPSAPQVERIANDDYFRALEYHKTIRDSPSEDPYYMIDKVVRQRLKEGWFGYDNSQVLALELEMRGEKTKQNYEDILKTSRFQTDEKMNHMLLERLENSESQNGKKLSYQEWCRKKAAEQRLKKHLMLPIFQYQWEQELLERQDQENKKEESMKKVAEWNKKKKMQHAKKTKSRMVEKQQKKKEKMMKKQEAKQQYRRWLRESLNKLKKTRKQNRQIKRIQAEIKKQQEKQLEFKQKQAKESYQEWLSTHKHLKLFQKPKPIQRRSYKPLRGFLAYSLNKKKQASLQITFDELSGQASGQSLVIQETSFEHAQDDESERNIRRYAPREEYKLEENKIFEQLSSIQRNPHILGQFPPEQQEQSFMSEEDSEI